MTDYEIRLHWKELQSFKNEFGDGSSAREENSDLYITSDLEDAKLMLPIYAERVSRERSVSLRSTSDRRVYGSDGEQSYELYIREVEP